MAERVGVRPQELERDSFGGFFFFFELVVGSFFWNKEIHSVSSGGRLISRKLVRTTLSADNLCKVFHRTGNLKLSNSKWHANIRNQHC